MTEKPETGGAPKPSRLFARRRTVTLRAPRLEATNIFRGRPTLARRCRHRHRHMLGQSIELSTHATPVEYLPPAVQTKPNRGGRRDTTQGNTRDADSALTTRLAHHCQTKPHQGGRPPHPFLPTAIFPTTSTIHPPSEPLPPPKKKLDLPNFFSLFAPLPPRRPL